MRVKVLGLLPRHDRDHGLRSFAVLPDQMLGGGRHNAILALERGSTKELDLRAVRLVSEQSRQGSENRFSWPSKWLRMNGTEMVCLDA